LQWTRRHCGAAASSFLERASASPTCTELSKAGTGRGADDSADDVSPCPQGRTTSWAKLTRCAQDAYPHYSPPLNYGIANVWGSTLSRI
jgi:hypothetical protein